MTSAPMQITDDLMRTLAENEGVCVRPMLHRVTDTATGETRVVPIRCGSTREAVCRPCAQANRALRMQQCREGWHLTEEPDIPGPDGNDHDPVDDLDQEEDDPDVEGDDAEGSARRVRSTRRRQDAPDLPRLPVDDRTVGKVFEGRDGKTYRPSMFATFTLPSYGKVRVDGTPADPARYDYRRAGLDAMHFSKLVDRLVQNLRRACGFMVQYFAAVEPQRRLAPHLHAAIRGAIPRKVFRQVVSATYQQVWWPPFDRAVYTQQLPEWSDEAGYVDAATGQPLPTWDQALDLLDEQLDAGVDVQPGHVVRFGTQMDLQGLLPGTEDAEQAVRYVTKYLTKNVADTYDPDGMTPAQTRHLDRLHEEVRWLPCSPRCWNWLRYGIQPQNPREGMEPGACPGKAHRRENLGCGGRRVLVSRKWTGKTLQDHKADRAAVVRHALDAAGFEIPEDADRLSATSVDGQGGARFVWTPIDPTREDPQVFRQALLMSVEQRRRWRADYEQAKTRLAERGCLSATGPPGVSEAEGDAA